MKTVGIVVLIVAALAVSARGQETAPTNSPVEQETVEPVPGDKTVKRRPLVVLKQSVINGRVFFIAQKEGDSIPAASLRIQVSEREKNKRLYETLTGPNGTFTLPNLDVGIYEMLIGKLRLELSVEEQPVFPARKRLVPKNILVFMPEEMK